MTIAVYNPVMTLESIKNAVERKPFRPFSIGLASGAAVNIQSEERVALHPDGFTLVVFEPAGSVRIVDIAAITELLS